MSQEQTVSVGIFHDATTARRAVNAARAEGFEHMHIVTEDPAVKAELSGEIEKDKHLLVRSPGAIATGFGLVGAGIGLLAGLVAVWFAARSRVGAEEFANLLLPTAGAIFGGFVGSVLSRGFTSEAQNFYDQEVVPGEILLAIETDTPARLALAERVLRSQGAAPVALPEG